MSLHLDFLYFTFAPQTVLKHSICVCVWICVHVVGRLSKGDAWENGEERKSKRKREQVLSVDTMDRFWKEMFDFLWNRVREALCHVVIFKHSALSGPTRLDPLPVFGLFCLCLPFCLVSRMLEGAVLKTGGGLRGEVRKREREMQRTIESKGKRETGEEGVTERKA